MVVGAAWVKQKQDGEKFLSCYIEIIGVKFHFNLFQNKPKEGEKLHEKAPQYRIVAFSDSKKQDNNFDDPFKE